ncbi:uncharacterized protein PAC_16759 [Phialocephala subalpina]|uniref:DUF7730 domain-containing protein n=1 Tax=Phialocephala subalpina TaxID=576137 RepID=A0A1L7XPA7_9HELO|nr:uncharacterized protein PAC_16759 [Phialocephala subalpina]
MPVTEPDFPLQFAASDSDAHGPRRRALTIPLPRAPYQPPESLLKDLSTTRKHLIGSPSIVKLLLNPGRKAISPIYPLIQSTHDQTESHIFKLPREIRDQIWRLLIETSPTAIHILRPWERKDSKLTSRSCTALFEIDLEKAWNLNPLGATNLRNKALLQELLNLVQTCRMIYSEVMELWYEKLQFVFGSPDQFNHVIFRTRHHRLTHLNIQVDVDSYSKIDCEPLISAWEEMCVSLNHLPSLKTLRINFDQNCLPDPQGWSAIATFRRGLFKALCLVGGTGNGKRELEVFELTAPWPVLTILGKLLRDEEVQSVPFDVRDYDSQGWDIGIVAFSMGVALGRRFREDQLCLSDFDIWKERGETAFSVQTY